MSKKKQQLILFALCYSVFVLCLIVATFPEEIQKLAQDFLHSYIYMAVGILGGSNTDVKQIIHQVERFKKRDKLLEILNEIGNSKVILFMGSKKQADTLSFFLIQKGYPTTSLHGDRLQSQREAALNDFKSGKCKILVATAVAARGLDIDQVTHVINYDLPDGIDEYVHRIGRTGRCGNPGSAISFFDVDNEADRRLARSLVKNLTQANQPVPEWLNDTAEGTVGSNYTGTGCTDDLRTDMKALNLGSAVAAPSVDEVWE